VRQQVYCQECGTRQPTELVAARLLDGAVAWRKAGDFAVVRGDRATDFPDPAARAAVAATLLYLPTGQVLNTGTGKVVTRLWTGQALSMSVGNGYVVAVLQSSPRVLDVYGLPGT
jgi:hypothetical protein